MNRTRNHPRRPHRLPGASRQWWALPAAFLATVLALPVNAGVTIPDEPMTTGTRVPPNLLFVLDNSGSMREETMPDTIANVSTINIKNQTYVRNVIYYNPAKNYLPWVDPTGKEMTGGTSYYAAYSSNSRVAPFDTTTVNLSDKTQTYYIPKNPADSTTFGNVANYWRYQILTSGAVERSEWDGTRSQAVVPTGYPATGLTANSGDTITMFPLATVSLPANAINMVVEATGAGNAKLYLGQGFAPTTVSTTDRRETSATTKTIPKSNPAAGDWYIALAPRVTTGYSNVTVTVTYQLNTDGCKDGGWINCTSMTPTGRSEADERTNFATWYSYHRTRFKVAKNGAGRAFSQIGTNYRVGYRNIWNDMPNSNTTIAGDGVVWPAGGKWNTHPITRAKPIPVTRNEGLFDDPSGTTGANNNRTAWFQRLYYEDGGSSTPLRRALWNAGNYFETDKDADGPWGPGKPDEQFTCRQSYTILTTDGYRNDDSKDTPGFDYTTVGKTVGEQDGDFPRPYWGGNQADTLADIAMRYWKTDLRPDMPNNVPSSIDDPATHQHMVTFSVSIGAAGTLNPETDLPDITSGAKSWPDSKNLTASSIDDLWHAAVNGRGKYVLADDPDKFTKALQDALTEIEKRNSSYSNVASSSVSLDTNTLVFNASYEQGSWMGDVVARSASNPTDVKWHASIGSWSSRTIITSEKGAGATFPTTDQKAALERLGGKFNYPVTGEQNADYIRGDASLEGANAPKLRKRTGVLGDIINSSPAYDTETDTLYVGANDGMLHAFNAKNGQEVFAYIPSIINWGLLSTLSRGDYVHKYFVDGPIVVSPRSLTAAKKNILVGSLGRGGKGLYALDVTNPTSMSASNFKWEIADTTGKNMGLVLGKPLLANVRNGSTTPAVVVANGPNSTNERAVLIVLDMNTGKVIREIDTGEGSAALPNGLSAPTGVYRADGKTLAYVYAGDLQGNVWKFDLSKNSASDWIAIKLFTATHGAKTQPISSGVTVAIDPVTSKRWVFFGTGRFLTTDDANGATTDVQTMYGFMEDDKKTLTRADLTGRTIITTGKTGGYEVRGFEKKTALPSTSNGWYIDLPDKGERIVQNAQVVATFLVTASMKPAGDACSSSGGGYINALDAFTGTSTGGSYFDLNGKGDKSDSTVNGVPVGSVNVEGGMPTLPNLLRGLLVVGGSAGSDVRYIDTLEPRWDRVAWHEVRTD